MDILELVIFVGAQGAGKSHFYRARFAATHALVSKDSWPNLHHKAMRRRLKLNEELAWGADYDTQILKVCEVS